MSTPQELEAKFWKALEDDRTVMLGLPGVDGGHLRPMTALVERERAPFWIFTARDTELARQLEHPQQAVAAFTAKGHGLFATAHGMLQIDNDRAVIDRLWNPYVAAWYEGGKEDPRLTLLRFDAEHAEVWLNGSSLLAGVKLLFGVDPKRDYQDKVARVDLR
jgi:general stress protein 26